MNPSDAELILEFKDRVDMAERIKELEAKLAEAIAAKDAIIESSNNKFDRIMELEKKLAIAVEKLKFGYGIVSSDYVTIANLDMMEIVFKDALEKLSE